MKMENPPLNSPSSKQTMIKISIIGNGGVGKTNLLMRFVDNVFQTSLMPTMGFIIRIRL